MQPFHLPTNARPAHNIMHESELSGGSWLTMQTPHKENHTDASKQTVRRIEFQSEYSNIQTIS